MKRDNRFLKGALVGALAMFCVIMLGGGLWKLAGSVGLAPALTSKAKVERKLNLIDTVVDGYYLYEEDVEEEQLIEGLYAGYLEALDDPYTNYFTKEETKELFESVSGEFFGVGAQLSQDVDTGAITITQVYEDSPAEKAGLCAEDILIQVDDHVIADESLDEIVTWIKGDQGTEVTLHVLRNGEELTLTAIRDTVQTITVDYEMKEGQIGYIYVQEFDDVTVNQFKEALEDWKDRE